MSLTELRAYEIFSRKLCKKYKKYTFFFFTYSVILIIIYFYFFLLCFKPTFRFKRAISIIIIIDQ